jgi:exonuclease III
MYLSIRTLNVSGLSSAIKRHHLANWVKKEDPTICCLQETHLIDRNKHWLRVKGCKKLYQANGSRKQAWVPILRQSRLQTYISQTRQKRSLHTNNRGNPSKVNNNYQPICTQCQCTQFHQTLKDLKAHIDSSAVVVGDLSPSITSRYLIQMKKKSTKKS